jgi:hypothetical protein
MTIKCLLRQNKAYQFFFGIGPQSSTKKPLKANEPLFLEILAMPLAAISS